MKIKKIPLRTCAITREKLPKKDLLRIVRTPEGNVIIDETGRVNGHGVYVKKDKDVIIKASNSKALDKCLETSVDNSIYEKALLLVGDDLSEE